MKTLTTVLVMIMLVSCGKDDSNEAKPQVETGNGEAPFVAKLFQSRSEIPDCAEENRKQLIYVREEGIFMTCDDEWTEIVIQAKDGKDGKDGKEGKDGITGVKGDKGDRGEAGRSSTSTEWLDPSTGKYWTFTSRIMPSRPGQCGEGYRDPTPAEIISANARGLCLAAKSLDNQIQGFWFASVTNWVECVDNTNRNYTAGALGASQPCIKE